MMNEAVKFDTDLALIYDETRPIDPEVCRACFRDVFQDILKTNDARIIDVGCGTGRILECLIPDLHQNNQAVGIDISPAMLSVAQNKPALRKVKFYNISAVDFAGVPNNQKLFDAVVCHWVFHCSPDWQNIFRACIDLVKENGVLAWLEEEGDLYRALDGIDTANEPLKRLFNAYYLFVNKELSALGLDEIDPSLRAGTALRCTDDLANELVVWGWNVRTQCTDRHWTKQVTVGWIISKIFQGRAFTNLRRIPAAINLRATNELKKELGGGGLPKEGDVIELDFWAKAVSATSARRRINKQSLQPIHQES